MHNLDPILLDTLVPTRRVGTYLRRAAPNLRRLTTPKNLDTGAPEAA
jgi:hypothetical protein